MKTNRTRWIACLLACAIGVSLTACGKDKSDSDSTADNSAAENSADETVASEDLEKMQKQDMTFQFAMESDDDSSGSADVPVNKNVDTQSSSDSEDSESENSTSSGGSSDSKSSNESSSGNGSSSGNNESDSSSSSSNGGNSSSDSKSDNNNNSSYESDMKTFQAYWLDMSSGSDVVCNGDFLDVTFKIKEDAPDGNYTLATGSNDFANWNAEHVGVSYVEGDVAVGSASQKTAGSAEDGTFTIVAGTAHGDPGDEVTVRFDMSDNPGIVALIFRFQYDANALEVVDATVGSDCSSYIHVATSE